MEANQSFNAVLNRLKGFVEQRYHAVSRYPYAPGYKLHMQHICNIRSLIQQALISSDQRFWAGMIIIRGTVSLFAITTKTNHVRKEKEERLITECLDILRIKTGRKAA